MADRGCYVSYPPMLRSYAKRGLVVVVAVAASVAAGGCGGVYSTMSINAAQSRLEQAREMGAETAAPYEYYYAREHLRQAQAEAAEASYGDAAAFAETAEAYAQKAIDLTQSAKHDGAGK